MRASVSQIINRKSRAEWEGLILQWVHSERERAMLVRYLLDGIPYEPLAEEFDLSTNRAREIVQKAKDQLFAHI